jgi:hypothetical protein
MDSGRLRVQATDIHPYSHLQVSLEALLPIDGSGLLADAAVVGISTWRAGAATLWIASIEDTATSTYDFHATHGKTNVIM